MYHGWSAFFPLWAREGERGAFGERLRDPEVRRRIRSDSTYTPDPIVRLNAALSGRYRIEREIGEGGMATVLSGR